MRGKDAEGFKRRDSRACVECQDDARREGEKNTEAVMPERRIGRF